MSELDSTNSEKSEKAIIMESPSNNNSLNSLESNGINSEPSLDMEMILADSSSSSSYTSLKELIMMSPSANNNNEGRKNSWMEIPLKDPLVQHAAWAYLQPMPSQDNQITHQHNRFLSIFNNKLSALFGCFNDVVFGIINACCLNGDQIVEHKQEQQVLSDCFG